jgi:hypothetical protein
MSPWYKRLVKWGRLVHLYLSLTSLALVVFFSVTGFMLNHEDWFVPPDARAQTTTGTIPTDLLRGEPDKLAVVELLRKDYGAVGLVSSFETDDDQLRIVFKRPGTEVEAIIKREDGEATVTKQTRGVNAILLDLHRGKSTGVVWSWVIDVVCVALVVMAGTGLVLFSSLKSRGRLGLLLLGAGLAASVYVAWRYAL